MAEPSIDDTLALGLGGNRMPCWGMIEREENEQMPEHPHRYRSWLIDR